MRTGTLRQRIIIEAPISTQDPGTGAMEESWSPVFVGIPASVEPLSVREFIASRAGQAEITARIVIRYREGISPSMRVLHDGQVYNIEGVLPDPKSGKEYLTLAVSGGVSSG